MKTILILFLSISFSVVSQAQTTSSTKLDSSFENKAFSKILKYCGSQYGDYINESSLSELLNKNYTCDKGWCVTFSAYQEVTFEFEGSIQCKFTGNYRFDNTAYKISCYDGNRNIFCKKQKKPKEPPPIKVLPPCDPIALWCGGSTP